LKNGGEMTNADKILVRKPEAKRPLRRPRYRWKDNIIILHGGETGREGFD
jgi:hypothetical protein